MDRETIGRAIRTAREAAELGRRAGVAEGTPKNVEHAKQFPGQPQPAQEGERLGLLRQVVGTLEGELRQVAPQVDRPRLLRLAEHRHWSRLLAALALSLQALVLLQPLPAVADPAPGEVPMPRPQEANSPDFRTHERARVQLLRRGCALQRRAGEPEAVILVRAKGAKDLLMGGCAFADLAMVEVAQGRGVPHFEIIYSGIAAPNHGGAEAQPLAAQGDAAAPVRPPLPMGEDPPTGYCATARALLACQVAPGSTTYRSGAAGALLAALTLGLLIVRKGNA